MGLPSIYPTGVTIYKPEKCWNGYNLVQIDYDGNIVWKFEKFEFVEDEGEEPNVRAADGGVGDWLHINCMSYLGPNKHLEKEIKPLDIKTYRLENAEKFGAKTVVKVEETIPYSVSDALCVAKIDESKKLNTEKLFTVNRNLFEEIIEEKEKVENLELVLFGAERCRHCMALHPVIEKVLESDLAKSIKAKYVDVDKNPEITEKYKVQGIPVIITTDGEKELSRKAGEKSYDELYSWLEELIRKNVK